MQGERGTHDLVPGCRSASSAHTHTHMSRTYSVCVCVWVVPSADAAAVAPAPPAPAPARLGLRQSSSNCIYQARMLTIVNFVSVSWYRLQSCVAAAAKATAAATATTVATDKKSGKDSGSKSAGARSSYRCERRRWNPQPNAMSQKCNCRATATTATTTIEIIKTIKKWTGRYPVETCKATLKIIGDVRASAKK